MYEYKVTQLRERMFDRGQSPEKLEAELNKWAKQGWRAIHIEATGVKGRFGGEAEGVLVFFERPKAA